MAEKRFKLDHLDLLEFALEGVQMTIGHNTGNPVWTREDWEYHYRAEKELERRIKIVKKQQEK